MLNVRKIYFFDLDTILKIYKNVQSLKKEHQQYQFKSLELTLIVHVYIATIFCFLYALQFFFAEVFDIRSFDVVLYLINLWKLLYSLQDLLSCHSIYHASSNTWAENGTSVIGELVLKLPSILMNNNNWLMNQFPSVYWSTFNNDPKLLITILWQWYKKIINQGSPNHRFFFWKR